MKRISDAMESQLNAQLTRELEASQYYLSLSAWAEVKGFPGIAKFLFTHSNEERGHALKFFTYINQRGGHARIHALPTPAGDPETLLALFESILNQEVTNSDEIGKLVDLALEERDHATNSFLQWFVTEQLEEEALINNVLDQLKVIGNEKADRGGLYEFDRNIQSIHQEFSNA